MMHTNAGVKPRGCCVGVPRAGISRRGSPAEAAVPSRSPPESSADAPRRANPHSWDPDRRSLSFHPSIGMHHLRVGMDVDRSASQPWINVLFRSLPPRLLWSGAPPGLEGACNSGPPPNIPAFLGGRRRSPNHPAGKGSAGRGGPVEASPRIPRPLAGLSGSSARNTRGNRHPL